MYSARHISAVHSRFWETFGRYMAPVLSSAGGRISWANYQTGIKMISFRMQVTLSEAYIAIEIDHKDTDIRSACFRKLHSLKQMFQEGLGEAWEWEEEAVNHSGKRLSRVFKRMDNVNICDENDWSAIISFLKPRIIALDAFWHEAGEFFDSFR